MQKLDDVPDQHGDLRCPDSKIGPVYSAVLGKHRWPGSLGRPLHDKHKVVDHAVALHSAFFREEAVLAVSDL